MSYGNPAYGDDYSASGIYVDGGKNNYRYHVKRIISIDYPFYIKKYEILL